MTMIPAFLLQDEVSGALLGGLLAAGGVFMLVMLAFMVVCITGMWKVFVKAGQPGWAVLIPIYNAFILLKIAGRPAWWLVLFIIPLVNFVVIALVSIDIAKSFGQTAVFGIVLLLLLGGIGYLILGFGSAKYIGPAGAAAAA